MREYEHRYPLEALDTHFYPNLYRDENGNVISENVTWFTLRRAMFDPAVKERQDKMLAEMEVEIKKYCPNAELAYHDASGNRWMFLIFNGSPSKDELRQMQKAYSEVYNLQSNPL